LFFCFNDLFNGTAQHIYAPNARACNANVYHLGIRDFLTKITMIFMIFPDCGHASHHGNH